MDVIRTDIAIIGGGLGACAAALAVASIGRRVVLIEETQWPGGQLTNRAVPPDEHPWIEEFGATATYRALREGIREYSRAHLPLTSTARELKAFNPGAFRMHPVEWNVGEAAGPLAAFCLDRDILPRAVRHRRTLLEEFQTRLRRQGIELHWPSLTPL